MLMRARPWQLDASATMTGMPSRELPPISTLTLRFFTRIVRSYFRRHFRAVLIQHSERFCALRGPLIVYANHSSWWDPMVSILLAQALMPGQRHYAPMDAAALTKYPVLRKLGIFPIEMKTARGAAQFLRTSQAILATGGVLWITPQGRFADNREPALDFKPGLGALAARCAEVPLLPLAIEYTFWDERLPETLLRFGDVVRVTSSNEGDAATEQLQEALATTMAELRTAAMQRDASAFKTLLSGGRGTGGMYALGRKIRSFFTRTPVAQDHTERTEDAAVKDSQ